jgi:hypothetical protein
MREQAFRLKTTIEVFVMNMTFDNVYELFRALAKANIPPLNGVAAIKAAIPSAKIEEDKESQLYRIKIKTTDYDLQEFCVFSDFDKFYFEV